MDPVLEDDEEANYYGDRIKGNKIEIFEFIKNTNIEGNAALDESRTKLSAGGPSMY